MTYYDLNVPYLADHNEMTLMLHFLIELGYTHIAINHHILDLKTAPATSLPPLPSKFDIGPTTDLKTRFNTPILVNQSRSSLTILRRCTVHVNESTMPYIHSRLFQLTSTFDILSFRPSDEASFNSVCNTLPASLISLDLGSRLPFHFNSKHSTLSTAVKRGCRFEITYAIGNTPTSTSLPAGSGLARGMVQTSLSGPELANMRRNMIGNATGLIRALRKGRGIVLSSGAGSPLACRPPADVVNLACVWGLGTDRAWEGLGQVTAGEYVDGESARRTGWRGLVDVVDGGKKPESGPTHKRAGSGPKANSRKKARN